MADNNNLIPIDPGGQLRLLPESVTDEMLSKSEAQQGICTGDRLRNYDPARYELVCTLLADGSLSQRQVSRIAGISRNLVAGISKSQVADIEPLKKRLAGKARNLAELCIERAEEQVLDDRSKLSAKDLMIGAGIMLDKSLLLSGEATQRIEVEHVDPDEFNHRFRQLPESTRARLAAMGLAAEISAPNRAPIDADCTESEVDK